MGAFYSILLVLKMWSPITRSNITWELVRNTNSWDPAQTYQTRDSGRGAPTVCAITNPSCVSDQHSSSRNTAVAQKCCFLRFQGCIYTKLSTPLHPMLSVTSSTNWIGGRNLCWGTSSRNRPPFLNLPSSPSSHQNPFRGLPPALPPLALAMLFYPSVHTHTFVMSYIY